MGMPSGARVPVAAIDNSRSKGSRKGSNLITVIAASSLCDVCRTCPGARGDQATSPEVATAGLAPPAAHQLFPPGREDQHPGGRAGLADLLTACRAHRTALLRWCGQLGHLFRA